MGEPVDIVDFTNKLPARRRGRAAIVLTEDYFEQRSWAERLSKLTNSKHINLLEIFSESEELSGKVDSISVNDLFGLLKDMSDTKVTIVSGIEFLKSIWAGQSGLIEEFLSRLQNWSQSPAFLFVTQHDKQISDFDFTSRYQYRYIVEQKETLAI